jgi:hypothetical protein
MLLIRGSLIFPQYAASSQATEIKTDYQVQSRSSDFRITLLTAPSQPHARPVVFCGFRPRLQRRARCRFSRHSLFRQLPDRTACRFEHFIHMLLLRPSFKASHCKCQGIKESQLQKKIMPESRRPRIYKDKESMHEQTMKTAYFT